MGIQQIPFPARVRIHRNVQGVVLCQISGINTPRDIPWTVHQDWSSRESRLLQMSELLPNLESLIDEVGGTGTGQRDARTLAEATRGAGSEERLDEALATVVEGWRRM